MVFDVKKMLTGFEVDLLKLQETYKDVQNRRAENSAHVQNDTGQLANAWTMRFFGWTIGFF